MMDIELRVSHANLVFSEGVNDGVITVERCSREIVFCNRIRCINWSGVSDYYEKVPDVVYDDDASISMHEAIASKPRKAAPVDAASV
jgi:hypothetical protein